MSDVLFDTAKYTLRPLARERLAKVAGILLGHPGLTLEVEGHTDSVGGEEYNQTPLGATSRIGARLSHPTGDFGDELGPGQRVRQVAACSHKRYSRRPAAQSARGTHCLRRTHWYADRFIKWVAVRSADNYLGLQNIVTRELMGWGTARRAPESSEYTPRQCVACLDVCYFFLLSQCFFNSFRPRHRYLRSAKTNSGIGMI